MADQLFHAVLSPNNGFQGLFVTQQIKSPTPRPKPLGVSSPKRRLCNISCSNNDYSSVDSKIVSAIELSDGSVLFRFENWSETETSVKLKESAEDVAKVSDVTHKQEILDKESSHVSKKQVKFHSKRRQNDQLVKDIAVHTQGTRSDLKNSLNNSEGLSEDTVLGSQTNVYPEKASNEKVNGEILSPAIVSGLDDVKQDNTAFEDNTERNGETRVNTSSVDLKSDLVSDIQKVCASLVVLQDKGVGETTVQFATSGSAFEIEPFNTCASWESSKESQSIEVPAEEHNVDIVPNHGMGEDGVEGSAIEVMPNLIALEDDPILDDKTTHNTVDEFIVTNRTGSSKLLDGFVSSSIKKEEIINPDVQSSKTAELLVSYTEESQLIGTALKRNETSTRLFLSSGAMSLAHPFKALIGRRDAYFVASKNWLGIADGIDQWSFGGIRAGLYAQELMQNCQKIVLESNNFSVIDPVEILNRSAVETKLPGSSTVLVAYFDGQALHVANVGDSGFIIIRNGTVIKRSSPMVHEFHFPIQIESGDAPSELVEEYEVELDEGDAIITASDGLFDNLYEQEIALIISKSLQDGFKPQEIAEALAVRAQEVGKSESARSPFADAAQATGYVGYRGGRLDYVTVIVSFIESTTSS